MKLLAMSFYGVFSLFAANDAVKTAWNKSKTAHFEFSHEAKAVPSKITLGLERIHGKLRLHLGQLAPWMTDEKVNIYIYNNSENYKNGEFDPPAWSKGISFGKTIVLFIDSSDQETIFETAAHELTHVLFTGFFKEKNVEPPRWLEEGTAMLMEDQATEDSDNGKWFRAMNRRDTWRPEPLQQFVNTSPKQEASEKDAGDWYLQAYSLTKFILTKRGALSFKHLCEELREGKELERALWNTYRWRSLEALQEDFLAWIKANAKPQPGARQGNRQGRQGNRQGRARRPGLKKSTEWQSLIE